MALNVYHLEVFFHVAREKGISQAAAILQREQPTISGLIADLEKSLGDVRLFQRRPFRLTSEGTDLFEAIRLFFTDLPKVEEKIRGGDVLRLGASPIILRDHLPAIESQVRQQFPKLRLFLREGNEPDLLRDIQSGDLDLAITLKPGEAPQKVIVDLLNLELPLVLLIPKKHPAKDALAILQADARENLISLPPNELVTRIFNEWLKLRDIIWRPSIEVTSLDLIQHFVRQGYGVGLSLHRTDVPLPPGLRELPLPDFPKVELALLYRELGPAPLFRAFVSAIKTRVRFISQNARHLQPLRKA